MRLQWKQIPCPYLQTNVRQVQNQEQTLEVRLPEGLPSIGRVLCAWGQPVLRSKQWRGDSISVSGGVTATVLYQPEDGAAPCSVEAWLPFQMKWSFPQAHRDGSIRAQCQLRSIDARVLSARKIMVRASVGVLAEALEPVEAIAYAPDGLPEGVELLKKTYPAVLPTEAGEKLFYFEDDIQIPEAKNWLSWQLQTEITEQSVVGGHGVFRGIGQLHYVYMDGGGNIHSGEKALPFAQFAELDKEYDKEATLSVLPAVSAVEPEQREDGMHIQCGVIAQYTVWDRCVLEVAEDAYSPSCDVELVMEPLTLPVELENRIESIEAPFAPALPGGQVLDVTFLPDHPQQFREEGNVNLELPGTFQMLYVDDEGSLQTALHSWTGQLSLPAEENVLLNVSTIGCHMGVQPGVKLQLQTTARQQIPMITALSVSEEKKANPHRPTLILRRMDADSLWELAKDCGSTMDAIRQANGLTTDPEQGQMLLIPVN